MIEEKFFCFGKNDFCDNAYKDGACEKCKHEDGTGGEMRPVSDLTGQIRLNREAWEPCSRCGVKVCENCFYGNTPACSECENCYRESNWKPESKYCPGCGRPNTDEAWAMLEKRLEGTINEKCL